VSDLGLRLWGIGTYRTMRVHWVLAELALAYETRPIGPRTGETKSPEFLRLNPKHKIPLLEHGPFVVSESAAIIAYLSETFAPRAGFFVPEDTQSRAVLNEWCSFITMELDAGSLYVIRRHAQLANIYGEAPQAVAAARRYFCHQIECITPRFAGGSTTLMPEGLSVADILLETCLAFALTLDIELPPPLATYRRRLTERPAYQRAFQRNYPGRPLPSVADQQQSQPWTSKTLGLNE
jgi:glutathione S-transferase